MLQSSSAAEPTIGSPEPGMNSPFFVRVVVDHTLDVIVDPENADPGAREMAGAKHRNQPTIAAILVERPDLLAMAGEAAAERDAARTFPRD